MRFEHLVQINDPLNPLIDMLSRDQLWRGLMRYIETPAAFVEGLDSGRVTSRDGNTLHRELNFGRRIVRDEVALTPMQQLRIVTEATAETPSGSLTVSIEEHGTDLLFVRFLYETFPQGHPPIAGEYQNAVKDAWRQAGIDVIRRIREYADEGRLDRAH
ncbi:MAG: DUF1857 family protein [Betaproteobacteria bacterium]|nr:DUF1857 family protein [Betaproteobacteria bacterium]